jgi:hypothetical protein
MNNRLWRFLPIAIGVALTVGWWLSRPVHTGPISRALPMHTGPTSHAVPMHTGPTSHAVPVRSSRGSHAPAPGLGHYWCRYRQFPDGAIGADLRCTPGALNPAAVANPAATICRRAYLAELGHAEAALRRRKLGLMIKYGSPGNPSTFVLAQVVAAKDGGSATDPRNLWPMPRDGWGGARTEAIVVNLLHEQICDRRLTVVQAARLLKGDWLRRGLTDED